MDAFDAFDSLVSNLLHIVGCFLLTLPAQILSEPPAVAAVHHVVHCCSHCRLCPCTRVFKHSESFQTSNSMEHQELEDSCATLCKARFYSVKKVAIGFRCIRAEWDLTLDRSTNSPMPLSQELIAFPVATLIISHGSSLM